MLVAAEDLHTAVLAVQEVLAVVETALVVAHQMAVMAVQTEEAAPALVADMETLEKMAVLVLLLLDMNIYRRRLVWLITQKF
tara:strand:- start:168 stop:413 length:246 start_codon:yes stop_codon:yes gene_type:complete